MKEIKSGDKIIFGDAQYIYALEYDPIIVTLSRITKTEKQKIEKTIKLLGGFICKNWDERCKYVIVNNDCECINIYYKYINSNIKSSMGMYL